MNETRYPETTGSSGLASTAAEKAREVAAAAGDLAGQATGKVQELAATAAEKAGQAKDRVQEWAAASTDRAGEAVREVANDLTDLVRRYPIPALLIGFGLGLLVARATRVQ
jgi:hypothetical protein